MNGLTSFVSENVTQEIKFNTNVYYLKIDDGLEKWINKIMTCSQNRVEVDSNIKEFEINKCAQWLQDYYFRALKRY